MFDMLTRTATKSTLLLIIAVNDVPRDRYDSFKFILNSLVHGTLSKRHHECTRFEFHISIRYIRSLKHLLSSLISVISNMRFYISLTRADHFRV